MNLRDLEPSGLKQLSDEEYRQLLADTLLITEEDRKQNQLLFYQPASKNPAKIQAIHDCRSKVVGVGGGNGSSKSETVLVDMVMSATGIFPYSQRHLIEQKFRGPIQCRLVVESLTTTLEPIILPKLQWYHWTGVDRPGGARGHWGWIPKDCLIDGEWARSWSAKLRVLTVLCRDPYNRAKVLGTSTIQCMSVDQDPPDFASGDFHIVVHDEPPKLAQWRENEARTMRVNGRMLLAMTWPDDPSIAVDWLYDEIYEPGRAGSPDISWFELWTTENKNLDQEAIATQAAKWSPEMAGVRIYGRPIRFSNRIHPEFTDQTKTWCLRCEKSVIAVPLEHKSGEGCPNCGAENLIEFNHVQEFSASPVWPTIFLIDPHPRKSHCMLWAQISPQDDWFVIAEAKVDGDCVDVRREAGRIEQLYGLHVAQRWSDPNMGASPASTSRIHGRPVTWQDEFRQAGLNVELADDSEVGRARVNTMLKVDSHSLQPRCLIHPRCKDTIYQLQRFSWDNYSHNLDRDQKQTPKPKHDDFPALLRYLANSEPCFRFLKHGAPIIGNPMKKRKYG